ncbi:MAG: C25 family cysteine peptidase [Planctomycetota bacterium]
MAGFIRVGLLLVAVLSAVNIFADKGPGPAVLLITDESLADAWQPFANFKTRIGLPTEIVTVQTIGKSYAGEDIQAKIRACVLDYIDGKQARYIILGGDSKSGETPAAVRRAGGQAQALNDGRGLVPDRDTPHRPHARLAYRDIPTDLYYLSPGDHDWDANNDGVYGDWANDMRAVAYTHPSGASLGRIPVRTSEDVAAYTDKVIAYETRYPGGGFASTILYTNTVGHSEPKVRKSWDTHLSKVWEGGKALRFFHTETDWDGDQRGDYSLRTDNWIDRLNAKSAGKMHMHGHGMPGYWVLEDDGGHTKCDARVVEKLTNEDAYLVMTTVSCFTGMFDGKFDPTITESMLRTPKKGAVVIVAPSREGVPIFHNPRIDFPLMVNEGKLDGTTESMTRFWMNGLSPREDGTYRTIGEAFVAMKEQMADHARKTAGYHWCQCELNLLGDPTLSFRAGAPVDPEPQVVSFSEMRQGDSHSLQLNVQTALRGAHGARLTVWQQGGGYAVVPIDGQGSGRAVIEIVGDGAVGYSVAGPTINAVVQSVSREQSLK